MDAAAPLIPTLADLDDGGAFTAAFNRHCSEAVLAMIRAAVGATARLTVTIDLGIDSGMVRIARRRISSSMPAPATAAGAATPDLFGPALTPEPRPAPAPKTKKVRAAKAPASQPKRKGKT